MKRTIGIFGIIAIFLGAATFSAFVTPFTYVIDTVAGVGEGDDIATTTEASVMAAHVRTPDAVRGVYMSSLYASSIRLRTKLVDLIDTTELNTLVLDIKDSYGKVSFPVEHPLLVKMGSGSNLIPDIREFIAELHEKDIYVVGRIAVFQDSYLAQNFPQYAVKTKAGTVWGDRKNVHWIDAGAEPVWEYIATLSEEAYALGFDEINFDYIRFPSDGNMDDIAYPYSAGRAKPAVLKDFFAFLDHRLRPQGIPISADLFGMVTSVRGDLGIGQVWENALAHFDYVAPMVYPSHYPPNFDGIANPNASPYETVFNALETGVTRARVFAYPPIPAATSTASTTATIATTNSNIAAAALATASSSRVAVRTAEIRPWLQDFSLGKVKYTPELVRRQIDATYDNGLDSWLLWNASNVYTREALR